MHRIQTSDNRFAADTVVTPEWLNSVQEEVANVVEYAGLRLSTSKNDLMTQLWEAIELIKGKPEYDYVVATQDDFNYLVERTGANAYKIKDAYKSVYFKYKSGGYLCYGTSSFLQTDDTWGYITTNLCTHLVFEDGAYLSIGTAAQFYILANTDDCTLDNVFISGDGTTTTSCTRSFLLGANRVIFNNCKVNNIITNDTLFIFRGSATAAHNITSKYLNCSAWDIENNTAAKDIDAFYLCYNLSNCIAYDLRAEGGGRNSQGYVSCSILSNCSAYDLSSNTGSSIGFSACSVLSSCYAYKLDTSTGSARGFSTSNIVSSCYANDIDASGAGSAYGFYDCDIVSACQANDIDSAAGTANGFNACQYLSAIYTAEAANASNDWADTDDDAITNKYSCPAVWT